MEELMVLIDGLPREIIIAGEKIVVNTDYRLWLLLDALLFDKEIRDGERAGMALSLIFGEDLPEAVKSNKDIAFERVMWFFNCGEKAKGKSKKSIKEKAYDYTEDWGMIYAAFLQCYHIDILNTEKPLHWWQFRALFSALTEECQMVKAMSYRTADLSKIKNKEQREQYRKLKEAYRLGDGMTTEEKIASAGALFAPKI